MEDQGRPNLAEHLRQQYIHCATDMLLPGTRFGLKSPTDTLLIFLLVIYLSVFLFGCASEIVDEQFAPTDTYEQYVDALQKLGIDDRLMGVTWIAAGEEALRPEKTIDLPFTFQGIFDPAKPSAIGLRFEVIRGRRIEIMFETKNERGETLLDFPYFVDVFRTDDSVDSAITHIASLPANSSRIHFEPRRNGLYLLRVQPELLAGSEYTITIVEVPSLAFPVAGKDKISIGSFFGDSRDGGAREHHGIDIFAIRGTNVLAPSPAIVRRVGTRGLGGKTVVLWDQERSLNLYFAHLDSQLVRNGERVRPGDVIGTVGNTGNAITTSPHLHFGIYTQYWQPIDPYSFVVAELVDNG